MATEDGPTLRQVIEERLERRSSLQAALHRTEMELHRIESELEVLRRIDNERRRPETSGQGQFLEVINLGDEAVSFRFGSPVSELLDMDRVAAVERVLNMTDATLSPSDIEQRLRSFGRDDEYDSISAALAHLKRTGRAHTPRRGEWRAGKPPSRDPRPESTAPPPPSRPNGPDGPPGPTNVSKYVSAALAEERNRRRKKS